MPTEKEATVTLANINTTKVGPRFRKDVGSVDDLVEWLERARKRRARHERPGDHAPRRAGDVIERGQQTSSGRQRAWRSATSALPQDARHLRGVLQRAVGMARRQANRQIDAGRSSRPWTRVDLRPSERPEHARRASNPKSVEKSSAGRPRRSAGHGSSTWPKSKVPKTRESFPRVRRARRRTKPPRARATAEDLERSRPWSPPPKPTPSSPDRRRDRDRTGRWTRPTRKVERRRLGSCHGQRRPKGVWPFAPAGHVLHGS